MLLILLKKTTQKTPLYWQTRADFFYHTFIQHPVCASKLNNLFGFLVLRYILLSYISPSELIYLSAEQVLYILK